MYYRKAFARATCWSTNLPKLRFPAVGSHHVASLAVLTWRVMSSSLGYKINACCMKWTYRAKNPYRTGWLSKWNILCIRWLHTWLQCKSYTTTSKCRFKNGTDLQVFFNILSVITCRQMSRISIVPIQLQLPTQCMKEKQSDGKKLRAWIWRIWSVPLLKDLVVQWWKCLN